LIPIDPDVPTYDAAFTFVVKTFVVVIEFEMNMFVFDQPSSSTKRIALVIEPVLSVLTRFIEVAAILPPIVKAFEAYRLPRTLMAYPVSGLAAFRL
jgi:hypothetical protein